MNISQPELVWIGGRCHRINPTVDKKGVNFRAVRSEEPKTLGTYVEEDLYGDDCPDEMAEYDIVFENDKFKSEFHVPASFLPCLIGSKGVVRKRMEYETKAQVTIPKQGVEGPVKVTAFNRDSVVSARQRIDLIVLGARKKTRPTHFLSIPFATDEIKASVAEFKSKVLAMELPGLKEEYFIEPEKIHVTFNVLALMDNTDRARTSSLIDEFVEKSLKKNAEKYKNIEVSIQGLHTFDPENLDKCRVVYAKVDSPVLQEIGNEILDFFVKEGLSFYEHGNTTIKMHMTVIKSSGREKFDATKIFKELSEMNFGRLIAQEMHLSQMKSQDPATGYYKATKIVALDSL